MPSAELVSFSTTDHLLLPGLLYQPSPKSKSIALFLHGNGSSSIFYKSKKMNLFAEELGKLDWAFLPFNNRGAHYVKKFSWEENGESYERLQGTALEVIADSVLDIQAAIEFAQARGFENIVLIGESSGANKICVFHHHRPNNVCLGYALVGGGDDVGLLYQELGKEKFWQLLAESKRRVAEGRAEEWLSSKLDTPKFTYQALADILDPDGEYNVFPFYEHFTQEKLSTKPLFSYFREIDKPLCLLYGSEDPFCYRPAEEAVTALQQISQHPELLYSQVAPGSDHSFSNTEEIEISHITAWLAKVVS